MTSRRRPRRRDGEAFIHAASRFGRRRHRHLDRRRGARRRASRRRYRLRDASARRRSVRRYGGRGDARTCADHDVGPRGRAGRGARQAHAGSAQHAGTDGKEGRGEARRCRARQGAARARARGRAAGGEAAARQAGGEAAGAEAGVGEVAGERRRPDDIGAAEDRCPRLDHDGRADRRQRTRDPHGTSDVADGIAGADRDAQALSGGSAHAWRTGDDEGAIQHRSPGQRRVRVGAGKLGPCGSRRGGARRPAAVLAAAAAARAHARGDRRADPAAQLHDQAQPLTLGARRASGAASRRRRSRPCHAGAV